MAPKNSPAPELVEDDVSSRTRIGVVFCKYLFMCWRIRRLQQYHAQTGAASRWNIEKDLLERIARIYSKRE